MQRERFRLKIPVNQGSCSLMVSVCSPEGWRVESRCRIFRGCGPNSKSSQSIQNVLVRSDTTAPKSNELLQKLIFGAVDGITKAANDRSYQCTEKQQNAPKAILFGAVDRIPKAANLYIMCLSDPTTARKAKNWSKSAFSGLWTEIQKQPINTKCSCQILYHSPEKQRIAPEAHFRGCGRNYKSSQWQILPTHWKATKCSKGYFPGLWTEFQKQPINTKCACPIQSQPRKAKNCSKSCFRGCGWKSKSNQSIPRKTKNCSKSSLSGLWTEFQKHPMTDPTPQPQKATNCSKCSFSGLSTEFQKQPMTDLTTCP